MAARVEIAISHCVGPGTWVPPTGDAATRKAPSPRQTMSAADQVLPAM